MAIIGIISNAMRASIKSKLATYKEEYETYMVDMIANEVDKNTINFGRTDENGVLVDRSIKEVMENIDEFYEDRVVIMHGELYYCYKANEGESETDEIPQIAKELGIKVIQHGEFVYDGETSVFAELTSSDEEGHETKYYMCTPDLSGFNADCTYYVSYEDISNVNTLKILNKISGIYTYRNAWYDYPQKNWANVLTMNGETMTYWVWIPRFAYKKTDIISEGSGSELSQNLSKDEDTHYIDLDVKFVNTNDEYWNGTEFVELTEDYEVPDAFNFDGEKRGGYWLSKYEVEQKATNNGDFMITASVDAISVRASDSTNTAEYSIYVDGELDTPEYKGRVDGGNVSGVSTTCVINSIDGVPIQENSKHLVTIFDKYGVRKWSQEITTLSLQNATEIASNVTVDISGFEKDTTYFVLYNSEGKSPLLIPFSGLTNTDKEKVEEYIEANKPSGYYWYNYGDKGRSISKIWANIATVANNSLTLWTYVPRYAVMQLGGDTSTSFDVRFIPTSIDNSNIATSTLSGTTSEERLSLNGYYVPDAFEFGGVQRDGYWLSKYEVQARENHPDFYAVVDQDKITINSVVTDTNIFVGTKFTVSIKSTDTSDTTEYGNYNSTSPTFVSDKYTTGVLPKGQSFDIKVYTKLNTKSGSYTILSWKETISTPQASGGLGNIKIDLTGFEDSNTKIELYDISTDILTENDGKNGRNSKEISLAELKSATNIVGSWNGDKTIFTSSNGKGTVTINSKEYVWFDYSNKIWANIKTDKDNIVAEWTYIPRYEYKVDNYGGTQINFIADTSTTATSGFTIPDAFNFGGNARLGYWLSKYEVQEKK